MDIPRDWNPDNDPTSILPIHRRHRLHAPDHSLRAAHIEFRTHHLWLARLATSDFSLASLTEFSSAGFHPVMALILGLGLLPPTLSELLTTQRDVQDRHEN